MINFKTELLSNDNETKLRKLFGSTELKILVAVVESMKIEAEKGAMEKALQSKQFSNYTELANSELAKAIRLKEFLDVLEELKARQDPFQIVKPESPGII